MMATAWRCSPLRLAAIAIPNAAVHRIDGETGVWAIRDGDLAFVGVTLGAVDADGYVQILSGLSKGEQFVMHSAKALSTNSRFAIVKTLP